MKRMIAKLTALGVGAAFGLGAAVAANAETPKRGGILNIVVGSKIPSYDGHQETTFGCQDLHGQLLAEVH